ncbi:MAG: DUF2336 domain-containing protein [Rhizobiales bacterium]|nr:DUF2336 domain-containing protein [Hyphomicrobiales bacterium]
MPSYSDPGNLGGLALREGVDIRSPLLRTLVDLYLQKPSHTAEEERHFTELAIRLLDQANIDTRVAMAQRLTSYPAVPDVIVRRLAGDVPEVAALIRRAGSGSGTPNVPVPPANERASYAELSELFFSASAAERRLILANLAYASPAAPAAFTGCGQDAARQLEAAALARKPDAFMRGLERWLGLAPALAHRIVQDPLGEPIVIAVKVIGVAPDALQRILLFVNPVVSRSVYRVYELAILFESLDAKTARTLVGIWRAADPRPPGGRPAVQSSLPTAADRSSRRSGGAPIPGTQRNAGRPAERKAGQRH